MSTTAVGELQNTLGGAKRILATFAKMQERLRRSGPLPL
jgi:hypothetical protein